MVKILGDKLAVLRENSWFARGITAAMHLAFFPAGTKSHFYYIFKKKYCIDHQNNALSHGYKPLRIL